MAKKKEKKALKKEGIPIQKPGRDGKKVGKNVGKNVGKIIDFGGGEGVYS